MKKIYSLLFGFIAMFNMYAAVASDGIFIEPHVMKQLINKYFVYTEASLWFQTFGKDKDYISPFYDEILVNAIENWNNCIENDSDALLQPECINNLCGDIFNTIYMIDVILNKEPISFDLAGEYCKNFTNELLNRKINNNYNNYNNNNNNNIEVTVVEQNITSQSEVQNAVPQNIEPVRGSQNIEQINNTPITQIAHTWTKEMLGPDKCVSLPHETGDCPMIERNQYQIKYVNSGVLHKDGHLNWRFNNPGNLRSSTLACNSICTKPNGKFAVFKTEEIGWQAMKNLLRGTMYKNLNILNAVNKYAPRSDNNNPDAYANSVKTEMRKAGITKNLDTILLKNLTDSELEIMMKAMVSVEGGAKGTVIKI